MNTITDLAQGFGAEDISSDAMRNAVKGWFDGYYGGGLLKLPYTIVRKLVRAMFAEYTPSGEALRSIPARKAMELALIGGESFLKPVYLDGWHWQAIGRNAILVFARDWFGEPTDVGLTEQRQSGRFVYTLLERRQLRDGVLTVTNRLFRSGSRGQLGREVSLTACDAFKELPETFVYPGTFRTVGLVRVKPPMTNTIDGSREGISIYAPAMELMEALEENEAQLRTEFSNGQSRLVVSRDMLRDGQLKDDLFVALDDAPETVGITVFSPQLRQESFLRRQQAYLRMVENIIGLKRGLLGEVEAVDRTATEITSSEGEYMTTILDLQQCFEEAAVECVKLLRQLGAPQESCSISWGDGVV